jgi:hypothetical protein
MEDVVEGGDVDGKGRRGRLRMQVRRRKAKGKGKVTAGFLDECHPRGTCTSGC